MLMTVLSIPINIYIETLQFTNLNMASQPLTCSITTTPTAYTNTGRRETILNSNCGGTIKKVSFLQF